MFKFGDSASILEGDPIDELPFKPSNPLFLEGGEVPFLPEPMADICTPLPGCKEVADGVLIGIDGLVKSVLLLKCLLMLLFRELAAVDPLFRDRLERVEWSVLPRSPREGDVAEEFEAPPPVAEDAAVPGGLRLPVPAPAPAFEPDGSPLVALSGGERTAEEDADDSDEGPIEAPEEAFILLDAGYGQLLEMVAADAAIMRL